MPDQTQPPLLTRLRICIPLLLALALCPARLLALVPGELETALQSFRTEGPFGWSFVQTSVDAEGKSQQEHFDPAEALPFQWTLLKMNGVVPSTAELKQYQQGKSLRSSALNAPRLEKQLDLESCVEISTTATVLQCRFKLLPSSEQGPELQKLSVRLTLDRPTSTITEVCISNDETLAPVFGVKIHKSQTTLYYSKPSDDTPSLLLKAVIELQGRAFWLKSMDQKLTITWSDHRLAGPKRKK